MSIDFYRNGHLELSIQESIFIRLENSNVLLEKQTGKYIDPYATTKLSENDRQLWLKGLHLCHQSLTHDPKALDACTSIINLIKNVKKEDTLIVVGE